MHHGKTTYCSLPTRHLLLFQKGIPSMVRIAKDITLSVKQYTGKKKDLVIHK